jgi:hypothetical protein
LYIAHHHQALSLSAFLRTGGDVSMPQIQNIPRLELRLVQNGTVQANPLAYRSNVSGKTPISYKKFDAAKIRELIGELVTAGLIGKRDFGVTPQIPSQEESPGPQETPITQPNEPMKQGVNEAVTVRTRIGRAILQNVHPIELIAMSFLSVIAEKIVDLKQSRPNSEDARAAVDAEIARCEDLNSRVEDFLATTLEFSADVTKESTVVNSTVTVVDGIANWWNKDHVQICHKTFDMALFTAGASLCWLAGAGGELSAAIPGVLVGGGTMVEALKTILKQKRK